jgi:hypothetical protein
MLQAMTEDEGNATILTEQVHTITDGSQPSHSERAQDLQEKS